MDALPDGCVAAQEVSTSGDECHHNLQNWTKGRARSFFKSMPLSAFTICENGGEPLTLDRILELHKAHFK
nr:hypothetical protein [uncultured bacterium]